MKLFSLEEEVPKRWRWPCQLHRSGSHQQCYGCLEAEASSEGSSSSLSPRCRTSHSSRLCYILLMLDSYCQILPWQRSVSTVRGVSPDGQHHCLVLVSCELLNRKYKTADKRPPDVSDNCCRSCRFPKGTLLRSWLTKSRPRLLLLIAGLKRPQVTLMRRKRMKRTKVAKAT